MKELYWPTVRFYEKQIEIIRSSVTAAETHVTAGNKLGKDYVSGFIALACFLVCQAKGLSCRIVTTSVAEHHLKVLWGEIGRFLTTASSARLGEPILVTQGGSLVIANYQEVRRLEERDAKNPLNYLVGRVSEHGEGLAGHHADFTLALADEASGLDNQSYEMFQGWAKHILFIGNPNPCANRFRQAVKEGTQYRTDGSIRSRVIKIRAEDSPNVQQRRDNAIPGVLTWTEYQDRRASWDKIRQCVGLDAEFYEGAEILMFPPEWLNRAHRLADELGGKVRKARAIGIDPAEGGDKTAMAAVDEFGLIELVSERTPDTSVIPPAVIAFARKHGLEGSPEQWVFDRGGGGKEHADRLRAMGYECRTVAFGETLTPDPKRGLRMFSERLETREERYAYVNRRVEMYHQLHLLMDPADVGLTKGRGFAIPAEYQELRRQLAPLPMMYDAEGRLKLPPKNKKSADSKEITLTEMLGCSPDEADAVVIAVYGLLNQKGGFVAGAL